MIKDEELDFLKLKTPKIDFLDLQGSEDFAPSKRKIVRIAEQAQIYTAQDLYNEVAILDRDILKGEQELEPTLFKLKVKNLKSAMQDAIVELKRRREMIADEIREVELALDIEGMDSTYNLALHEKLKAEELKETK